MKSVPSEWSHLSGLIPISSPLGVLQENIYVRIIFKWLAFSQVICHSAGATLAICTYWCLSSIHILAVLSPCRQRVNMFPAADSSSASRFRHPSFNPFLRRVCATEVWWWLVLTDHIKLFSKLIKPRHGCEGCSVGRRACRSFRGTPV